MRLLLICPSWGRQCGIAWYTKNLRRGLESLGLETAVAARPRDIEERLRLGAFDGILMQHEYGLYYFNLVQFLNLVHKTRVPFAITMHNTDNTGWMAAQHIFLFRGRARFVVHSEAAARNMSLDRQCPSPDRLFVIPMGCPTFDGSRVSAEEIRRRLELAPERFVVGFFGFASAHKETPNLIRAILAKPYLSGYIHATTHPTNPRAVDDIYRECGLPRSQSNRVTFRNLTLCHDPIPDEEFGAYQRAMNVIVLPYTRQGKSVSTSMMAHEAIASLRPVMTTSVVYFSDLRDEVLKIADASPESIGQGLESLYRDQGLRQRLVHSASKYVEANTWSAVARRYLGVLGLS
jgi:glycosyltransferase involved in cell wall biosynthesis